MRWLIVLWLAACVPAGHDIRFDVEHAMSHVEALVTIGPRPQDSDGSRSAAGYIEDELDRLGLDVRRMAVGTVDLPEIRLLGTLYRPARRATTTDPNLLVRFGPAEGKALLVMAHYDTVPASPGAIDNAAAVGMLLELARELRDTPPPQPVIFAFTANEEIGLAGAEALAAQHGHEVAFAISLDLIGGDGALTLNGASELIGLSELRWIAAAADRAGIALSAPLAHRVISRWWPQIDRSDHGPFTRRGIRAVHFYHRGHDGEWIDLDYHSARDVSERVERSSLLSTARLVHALAYAPVPAPGGDGFWLPLAANTAVPRWALVAAELVLALAALVALVLSRDGLVAMIARRVQQPSPVAALRGAGLLAGIACYVVAIVLACVVERELAGVHPAPWLHDPLRALVAYALVLAGAFGLATRVVARVRSWRGAHRYLAVGAATCLVLGITLLALGAAELAWIWLIPAATLSLAPRVGPLRAMFVACAALPLVLVLHPWQLREAAWNGFLPDALPLSLWIGFLALPLACGVGWLLRGRRPLGPLGSFVQGVGCGLAVVLGLVFAVTLDGVCSPMNFERFHLACERV